MHLLLLLCSLGLALAGPFTSCPGGYKNGEKIKAGMFVKKCTVTSNGYSTNVVACLTTKGAEVPLGSKLEENNLVWHCKATSEGGAEIETSPSENAIKNAKCDGKYTNGQTFKAGNFVKKCTISSTSWSISIVACLSPAGKEFALGSKTEEGKMIYSCVETEKGAKIETDMAVKGCEDGKFQKGETFLSSNKRFLLKCLDDYGSNDIVACITDEGKEVKVGAELTEGSFKYRCVESSDGSVRYQKNQIRENPKGCGQYAVGDHILSTDKKFKFTCVSDGKIEFTACVVEGGEVKANTEETIGKFRYNCKSSPNGGASVARTRIA